MASQSDRWLFLLTLAPIPLACGDEVPVTTDGSTGTTTDAPPITGTTDAEGSTGIVTTTGVDGTSSSSEDGTTVEAGSSTDLTGSSSSEGTTMSVEPGSSSSSSEESSTTGEPLGLCELWGEIQSSCYGYYNPAYLANYCYDDLNGTDPMCGLLAAQVYQCEATGCFTDCSTEDDALDDCNDLVEAMQLGCDMIPVVPAAGTIEQQCTNVASQAFACDAAGYYIGGFSQYTPNLGYAISFCTFGAYLVFSVPLAVGDPCGGAYEELLTCLSGLTCGELTDAVYPFDAACQAQKDAVTCRCELGA